MPDRDLPPPALPWWLITLGTLGVLGLYVVFVLTTTGQSIDNRVMERARAGEALYPQLLRMLYSLGPTLMVPLAGLVAVAGLVLRGWRTGLGALVGAVTCLVAPQILKAALPRPQLADPWPMPNSLPSGHTAAIAAVVVALLIVVPRSFRGTVLLLGVVATLTVGALVLVLGHHRASDVLASGCVAMIGWGVGLLVQGWRAEDQRRRPRDLGGSFGGRSPSSEASSAS